MIKNKQTYYVQLHLAVLLFGGAGLFGKLIHTSAGAIVLGRAACAALFLLAIKKAFKESYATKSRQDLGAFLLLGFVLAFHWVAFFQSIQLATVAVGVLTFSTFPIFTIVLESLWQRTAISVKNLALGFLAALGVYLIVPNTDLDLSYTQGIWWGIASGASFAILTLLNKKLISDYSPNAVSFYQNGFAALFLLPLFANELLASSVNDMLWLVLLGIVFTGIAHTLFIASMRGIHAQTASLVASLEPVYGILLAWALLGESPSTNALLGGAIILSVAFIASIQKD